MTKHTNKEILDIIRKGHAMTETELQNTLGYGKSSLNRRLRRLIMLNLVDYVILPGRSATAKYNFFRTYTGKRLFYVEDADLMRWVWEKLPNTTNIYERRAITRALRKEFGIAG